MRFKLKKKVKIYICFSEASWGAFSLQKLVLWELALSDVTGRSDDAVMTYTGR